MAITTMDMQGREYLKLSKAYKGQDIWIDGGFECAPPGKYTLFENKYGLYFKCNSNHHYLDGQADGNGGYCIGTCKTR